MHTPPVADPYRFGDRIEQVVAHHACRVPHAPAVQQGDRVLTYEELVTGAARVAASLRRRGVAEGDIVPVFLGRSCDLVVTLLGVLRVGAAYIAMDLDWPERRVTDVLSRSGARLVVTGGSPPPSGVDGVSHATLVSEAPTPAPPLSTGGRAAACVFYTSGSTGRPKGVLSPHRGTIRTLVDVPSIPLDETTVFLQAAPLPWDGFALEVWAALLNGGRCVLMDADRAMLEPDALRSAIDRGVNSLWLTSSLFNLMADEVPDLFGAIRLLLVGGERVSPAHVRRVLRRFPGLRVVNGYGPAESTIFTTVHPLRESDVTDRAVEVPIGRPVPHTEVRLLNPDGFGADGRFGEIAVSGDGLALGYLADPEETRRRFVVVDGVRCYRTGDLAEEDEDGLLWYRGRLDRQIKINGVRVEPGEVDAVIEAHPEVASAYTLRVEPRPDRPVLATLYTTRHGRAIDAATLREFAAGRLIGAMVPDVLCHRPELPLGTTGKTDQDAARRIALAAAGELTGTAAEPGATQDELLDLVRLVLGRPRLEPHEDILHAGASSLEVMRLVARLDSRPAARLSMADLYRWRTVDELRRHVRTAPGQQRRGSGGGEPLAAPLSYAQRRFWMAEQIAPGMMDNLIQLAYLLIGPIRPAALEAALRDVVDRHAVLRTVYPPPDSEPVQQVLGTDHRVRVEWVEPPGDAAPDPEPVVRRLSDPWWSERFNLDSEPPVRFRLARLAADRHVLFVHVHHIAFDGWSEAVFLADLAAAYRARSAGEPWRPTRPPFSYARYSLWEAASLPDWTAADLPYWRRQLADVDAARLPLAGAAGAEVGRLETAVQVPADGVDRLHGCADRHGGPRVSTLLAGVGRALYRTLGIEAVVLGTTCAGRFTVDSQAAVGYFVNPLAVPMAGLHRPATDLVPAAIESTLGALRHARTPFDVLVRDLGPPRDRHPFFQVWVVLQWAQELLELSPGVRVRPIRVTPPRTAWELIVEAIPTADAGWDVVVQWREDGIDRATAEVLAADLGNALAELG